MHKGRDFVNRYNLTDRPRPFLSEYDCSCTKANGCLYVNYVSNPKRINPTCYFHASPEYSLKTEPSNTKGI